jgi:hypothetical protein
MSHSHGSSAHSTRQRCPRCACRKHACKLCFSDEAEDDFPDPHRISEAELRTTFTGAWRIDELHRDTYVTAFTREYLEKQAGGEQFPHLDTRALAFDGAGRLTRPIWRLTAVRL